MAVEDRVLRHEDVAHLPVVALRGAHPERVPRVVEDEALGGARDAEEHDPRSTVGSSNRAIVERCVQIADSVAKTFSPVTR